jgi:hypothetical protein
VEIDVEERPAMATSFFTLRFTSSAPLSGLMASGGD